MLSEDLIRGARDAAKFTGLSERAIYHLTEKGHLPVIRKGRCLFYRKTDLEKSFSTDAAAA